MWLGSGGNQLFIAVTNLLPLEAETLIADEDKTVFWMYDQISIHQITYECLARN